MLEKILEEVQRSECCGPARCPNIPGVHECWMRTEQNITEGHSTTLQWPQWIRLGCPTNRNPSVAMGTKKRSWRRTGLPDYLTSSEVG